MDHPVHWTFARELLVEFTSWGEVQDYATYDPAGGDLQPFVDLVEAHGPDAILAAVDELTEEVHADVTVSTAHKAKGREWPVVRIADDFPPPRDTDQDDTEGRPIPEPVNGTDARLAYVAVTRARHHLDLGGLSWIDSYPSRNTSPSPLYNRRSHPTRQADRP
jgi:superfamily I DNA/RNA helicase